MPRPFLPVFFLAGICAGLVLSPSGFSGQVVSTMRNVNAVMEARGYRLQPAPDVQVPFFPGDHAPAQAFELIRPRGEAVRIGRLYTSCSCVRLEVSKNSFARDERAVFILRNVIPTPVNGHTYAMYVQVTRPLRTTLRVDTFFQSDIHIAVPEASIVTDDAADAEIPLIIPTAEKEEPAAGEPAAEPEKEEPAAETGEPGETADSGEKPAAEPAAPASPETAPDEAAPEPAVVELKVTEAPAPAESDPTEQDEEPGHADDQEVAEYVSKYLESNGGEADAPEDKAEPDEANGETGSGNSGDAAE